jgi:hypothetical protein
MERTILLLVGPKGAGKTYLGTRLERKAGIPFVRVEPIWLEIARTEQLKGEAYDNAGQARVLSAVEDALRGSPRVALESTGTAPWFPSFLESLGLLGRVAAIRIRAPAAVCLSRVRCRPGQDHIPLSDDRVQEINAIADSIQLPWALILDNNTQGDADTFVELIRMHQFN